MSNGIGCGFCGYDPCVCTQEDISRRRRGLQAAYGKEFVGEIEESSKAKSSNFSEPEEKTEQVNHPPHYGGGCNPYEAIKVIEAWELDFCLGNTVKYISRAGKKGDKIEDLEKAAWYLNREIQTLKEEIENENH